MRGRPALHTNASTPRNALKPQTLCQFSCVRRPQHALLSAGDASRPFHAALIPKLYWPAPLHALSCACTLVLVGTVKTVMSHPRKGPTQLFRRDLSAAEEDRVLENPRAHTGKGYYTKSDNSYRGSSGSSKSYNSDSYNYNGSGSGGYSSGGGYGYSSYRNDRNDRKEAYYGRKNYSRKNYSRNYYYD